MSNNSRSLDEQIKKIDEIINKINNAASVNSLSANSNRTADPKAVVKSGNNATIPPSFKNSALSDINESSYSETVPPSIRNSALSDINESSNSKTVPPSIKKSVLSDINESSYSETVPPIINYSSSSAVNESGYTETVPPAIRYSASSTNSTENSDSIPLPRLNRHNTNSNAAQTIIHKKAPEIEVNDLSASSSKNWESEKFLNDLKEDIIEVHGASSKIIRKYISKGLKIGEYFIENIMCEGGEAVLYTASTKGHKNQYVIKIYTRPIADERHVKSKVDILKKLDIEYNQNKAFMNCVVPIIDFGYIQIGSNKVWFEVMHKISVGTLADNFNNLNFDYNSFIELVRISNEALHTLHKAGIIHRDIKPSNIFITRNREARRISSVMFTDFGIAEKKEVLDDHHTQFEAGTNKYKDRLASIGRYSESSDYYALGLVLAGAYLGHDIWDGCPDVSFDYYIETGMLPIEEKRKTDGFENISALLHGCFCQSTRFRWGYKDIKDWCKNQEYKKSIDNIFRTPYQIEGTSCKTHGELFNAVIRDEKNWSAFMYDVFISDSFYTALKNDGKTDLARYTCNIKNRWNDNQDAGIFRILISVYPEGEIVWKRTTYSSLKDMADRAFTDEDTRANIMEMLESRSFSFYTKKIKNVYEVNQKESPYSDDIINLLEKIEDMVSFPDTKVAALYRFMFSFSAPQSRNLRIDNEICNISNVDEFVCKILERFANPETFFNSYQDETDAFSFWKESNIIGFLYGRIQPPEKEYLYFDDDIVTYNLKEIKRSKDGEKKSMNSFLFLEKLAQSDETKTAVRRALIFCGPYAAYWCIHDIIDCYQAFDNEGMMILKEIRDWVPPKDTDHVEFITEDFKHLIESIEKMTKTLQDNPYLIERRIFRKEGVVINNSKASLMGRIYGNIPTPLHFKAWVKEIINQG